jgi:CRP-like cAMP-binding protein
MFAVEHAPTDVDRRLAATLVELAKTHGVEEGTIVMLDVAQGDLAGMLRVDPESISGAIKRLRARGLVLPGRRSLHVVNIRALEAVARS